MKVAQALGDGREPITFSKGTGKDRGPGKKTTVLRFLNGDRKKILPDQRVVSPESKLAFSFESRPTQLLGRFLFIFTLLPLAAQGRGSLASGAVLMNLGSEFPHWRSP